MNCYFRIVFFTEISFMYIFHVFSAVVKRQNVGLMKVQNVLPEHLKPKEPLLQRFVQYLKKPEATLWPMGIVLLGAHVLFIAYLRSEEFKEDFKYLERLPIYAVN